jgi:hypothetical protein
MQKIVSRGGERRSAQEREGGSRSSPAQDKVTFFPAGTGEMPLHWPVLHRNKFPHLLPRHSLGRGRISAAPHLSQGQRTPLCLCKNALLKRARD